MFLVRYVASTHRLRTLVDDTCSKMLKVITVAPRLTDALSQTLAAAPLDPEAEPGMCCALWVGVGRVYASV